MISRVEQAFDEGADDPERDHRDDQQQEQDHFVF
jgi:hypothetical protein